VSIPKEKPAEQKKKEVAPIVDTYNGGTN